MAKYGLLLLAQIALVALLHYGEVDKFWFGLLEIIWFFALVGTLIVSWINATYGEGV